MKKYIVKYSIIAEKEVPNKEEAKRVAKYMAESADYTNVRIVEFDEGETTRY